MKPGFWQDINPVGAVKATLLGAGLLAVIVSMMSTSAKTMPELTAAETVKPLARSWHGLPNYSDNPAAVGPKMRQLARKSDGDMKRLTPDERRWMYVVASTYAPLALRMNALEIHWEDAKKLRSSHRIVRSRGLHRGKQERGAVTGSLS